MVKTQQKITAVVLSILMLLACAFVGNVSITANAATGDVIYFEKPSDWSSVSCYTWGGTSGANAAWPGTAMTAVAGKTNIYSYTMTGDQTSVIFNNSNAGSQTADLTFAGGNKIFKLSGGTSGQGLNGAWSDYESDDVKTPTVKATPGTSSFVDSVAVTLTAKNTTTASYCVNGGAATTFTDGTKITLGAAASIGDTVTLKLTGTDGTATDTQSYTYTKTATPAFTGAYAYLENEAKWSSCYVYYWNGSKSNAAWPGKQLTDNDKDAAGNYEVAIPEEYIGATASGVIFNDGGSGKSADLTIASGESKIYNNSTGSWEIYDTSAVKFASFGTDLASPQYKETDITVSATAAGGSGEISYRFTAVLNGAETVLSDYSSTKSVVWSPAKAGTYTVKCDVKDTAGNTNSRSLSYIVKDDTASTTPVLKGVTPTTGSEIKKGTATNLQVKATGGVTGTNLLFYKVAVKDPIGNPVNIVYYKLSNSLSFTPSMLGAYSIEVSVQNSANNTVKNTYTYQSVGTITPTEDVTVSTFTANKASSQPTGTAITLSATATKGTAPYTYQFAVNGTTVQSYSSSNTYVWTPATAGTYTLTVTVKDSNNKTAAKNIDNFVITGGVSTMRGDANMDSKVNMRDVALMQNYVVDVEELSAQQKINADVTDDGKVDMRDIAKMQNYLNDLIDEL